MVLPAPAGVLSTILMTGAMVNYDQSVWGAYDSSPHPAEAVRL